MDKEIYEVTRDEFKGFLDELKPECVDYRICQTGDNKIIRVFAKDSMDRLFAEQILLEGNAQYYIYEMPRNDERQVSKPIRKIVLETKEEVEKFFEVLNKIQKGEHNNDGIIP